jgi:hypothetical protein
MIFYAIYKFLQFTSTISVTTLQSGPLDFLQALKYALLSRIRPRSFSHLAMSPLGRWSARVGNSGEGRRLGRSGTGVEWPRGASGPIWEGGPSGEAAGDGRRRCARVAAAGALAPASLGRGKRVERLGSFCRG